MASPRLRPSSGVAARIADQIVTDDDTREPHGVPQQLPQLGVHAERQARRRGQLAVVHVCRHDGADAGIDGRAEGRQIDVLDVGKRASDDGEVVMRVHLGVAVSGKVLGHGDHAPILQASNEGRTERPNYVLVAAEGAVADDVLLMSVRVDVENRREIHVDSKCAQLRAGDPARLVREVRVSRLADAQSTRQLGEADFDPVGRSVLLVCRDQEGNSGPVRPVERLYSVLQLVGQPRYAARHVLRLRQTGVVRSHAPDVALEKKHGTDLELLQERCDGIVASSTVTLDGVGAEANHEELPDLLSESHPGESVFDELIVRWSQRLPRGPARNQERKNQRNP